MNYYTLPPSDKLKGLVRFFWVFEMAKNTEPYIYRSMADPCCELLFHYKGRFDELSKTGERIESFLSGIHSQTHHYRRFITEEAFGIFGVYLYPFATRQFFNLSANELTNQMPDLHAALGSKGKELEEQMLQAANNQTRYHILSEYLEKVFHKYEPDQHPALKAVTHIIHSKTTFSVRELANHYNLSERQFERKFKEYSGFTPKKYMRIVRFSEACSHYSEMSNKSLAEIAHSCGYYDQSHFIKEFKSFSGYSPADYFYDNAEGTEWRDSIAANR